LGQCDADCGASQACDGDLRCDSFGRCRSVSDTTTIAPLSAHAGGSIRVEDANLLVSGKSTATLRFKAVDHDSGAVRVTASAGFELQCEPGAEWTAECNDSNLKVANERSLAVRASGGQRSSTGTVHVYHDGKSDTVSVTPTATPALAPLQGAYVGTASLVNSAVSESASALATAANAPGLSVPISAQVFAGGVLTLSDPLFSLGANGAWTGSLAELDETSGTASFPRILLESAPLTHQLESEVVASVSGASYTRAGSSLSLTLPVQIEGVLPGTRLPRVTWLISLQRSGDLASGTKAPKVLPDFKTTLPKNALGTPSDWSQAMTALYTSWDSVVAPDALDQLLFTWQGDSGTDRAAARRVDGCTASGRSVAARQAALDEWRAVTYVPSSFISPLIVPDDVKSNKNALLGVALSVATAKYLKSATVTRAVSNTTEGAIPCAIEFDGGPVYCNNGLPNTVDLQLAPVDRCAEIAAEMRCNVAAGTGDFAFDMQLDTSGSANTSSCLTSATHVTGTVKKVCTLPPVAWNCGELVSCATGTETSSSPSSSAKQVLTVSGDLPCGSGDRTLATPADQNRNEPANTDTVSIVVEHALTDLATLQGSPITPFPSGLALDTPRTLVALEFATEVDRSRALDATIPATPAATRFALRLFQQWLGVQALIAHEASQHWQVPDALTGTAPDPLFPNPKDALSKSLDAWSLLFHPRFAAALAGMDGAVIAAPDYRADWLSNLKPAFNDLQGDGSPIAILETVQAQLDLVNVIIDQAWPKQDKAAWVLIGRTLRDALLARALAQDLYARAAAVQPALSWADKYQRIDASVTSSLRVELSRATHMQAGDNPLGIEDSDLPLYFYGASADPSARFSSISDYLLGNASLSQTGGWAPQLVAQAAAAAKDVGDAYQTQVTRGYQAALSTVNNQNRLDDIRLHWGDLVSNLCGLPDGITTAEVLEKWPNFEARTCYFASERPDCQIDTSAIDSELDRDTVLYHLCVAQNLYNVTGLDLYADPGLNQVVRAAPTIAQLQHCTFTQKLCNGFSPAGSGCVDCDGATEAVRVAGLAALDSSRVSPDQLKVAQNTCLAAFPAAHQSLPKLEEGGGSALAKADCYRGSIGDAAFAVLDAQKDVEIARGQYSDHLDAYEIEMDNCWIKIDSNMTLDAQRALFNDNLKDLRDTKAQWDETATIAAGVKDCATASTAGAGLSGISLGASAIAAAVACGAAITESVANVASIKTQKTIDNAQTDFDSFVSVLGEQTDVKLCMNEAHQQLVGIQTAKQQIERALLDLAHASGTISGDIGTAQVAFNQGRAALATAIGRTVRPPSLDTWVDEHITGYLGLMQQARRVSYLAERAVEYEYQSSLASRQQILSAETPDDLNAALSSLRNTSGTLGINGHRPSSLKIVLSMRDHLLQLFDTAAVKKGEQRLSEAERFRLLLNDQRFAVYENGAYAGQRIPFGINPLEALHGDTKGISVFGSTDCAERIWSVNASVLGGEDVHRGADASSFVRVDLLKANTFYSQWCGGGGTDTDPFQLASVRPSHNLFRDPSFGLAGATAGSATGSSPGGGATNEISQYSRARIQAYFNVARDTFEADAYENGDTSELAARGLFGDYALFFPAGILSVPTRTSDGGIVGYSDGLNLNGIDDILLRLDYVSVAR
jgi:hypothetical protein